MLVDKPISVILTVPTETPAEILPQIPAQISAQILAEILAEIPTETVTAGVDTAHHGQSIGRWQDSAWPDGLSIQSTLPQAAREYPTQSTMYVLTS
jgi:hypothetical protein